MSYQLPPREYPAASYFGAPDVPAYISGMNLNVSMANIEHATWLQQVSIAGERAGIIGNLPIEFIPPWLLKEDYRPESRQVSMYIIDAVFFGLALFMVIARIWTRAFIIKKFGPDDWFIVLALISVAGFTALQFCFLIYAGVGYHIWDVSIDQLRYCYQFIYFHLIGYSWCVTLIKLSILFLYRRIIPKNHAMNKVVIGFFIIHVVYLVAALLTYIFQCNPITAALSLEERIYNQPKCIPLRPLFFSFGIIHIFLDFALLTLPVKVVWQLNISKKKKATTILMFVMGALACFCPVMRMVTLDQLLNGYDMTWVIYDPGMWGQLELTIGIICACIPPSKLFFKRMFEPLSNTTSIVCRSFVYTPSPPGSNGSDPRRGLPVHEKRSPPPSYGAYDSLLEKTQMSVIETDPRGSLIIQAPPMPTPEFTLHVDAPASPGGDTVSPLPPAYARGGGIKSEKIATLDELENPKRRPSLLRSVNEKGEVVQEPRDSYERDRRASAWTANSSDGKASIASSSSSDSKDDGKDDLKDNGGWI